MRCPDCGRDFPVKPEVIKEKEPCRCGMTVDVRIARYAMLVLIAGILCLGGSCWMTSHYNSKLAEKGDTLSPGGGLYKAEKK